MKGFFFGDDGFTPELICRMIGVGCITLIEIIAINKGLNGVGISISVGAIAGILGVKVGQAIQKKINNKEGGPNCRQ